MGLGDSEPQKDVRASARQGKPPAQRPLVRGWMLAQLIVEIEGAQKLLDECIAADRLRDAGEVAEDLDRLTQEYGQKLSAYLRSGDTARVMA